MINGFYIYQKSLNSTIRDSAMLDIFKLSKLVHWWINCQIIVSILVQIIVSGVGSNCKNFTRKLIYFFVLIIFWQMLKILRQGTLDSTSFVRPINCKSIYHRQFSPIIFSGRLKVLLKCLLRKNNCVVHLCAVRFDFQLQ